MSALNNVAFFPTAEVRRKVELSRHRPCRCFSTTLYNVQSTYIGRLFIETFDGEVYYL